MWVTAPQGATLYGVMSTAAVEDNGGSGSKWAPFAFRTIRYGDYSRDYTVPLPEASNLAPELVAGDTQYTVGVLTTDSAKATVVFKVNP